MVNDITYISFENLTGSPDTDTFTFLPGAQEAVRLLSEHGVRLIVVTNQPGLAKGTLTDARLRSIHRRLTDLLAEGGPATWEDDGFGVHFAFFGLTRADVRLRILEGRRSRLEERMEAIRAAFTRTRERVDRYTEELHRHGLESVEREVRWLNELIASEREAGQSGADDNISEKESS